MGTPVLIADADDVLSDVLAYYLSERGYWVETAADRPEFLSKIREFQPQTVVIDVDLLWGDGASNHTSLNGDVPPDSLMLVIGHAGPDELAVRTGVPPDCCFRKPFQFQRLLERIRSGPRQLPSESAGDS